MITFCWGEKIQHTHPFTAETEDNLKEHSN